MLECHLNETVTRKDEDSMLYFNGDDSGIWPRGRAGFNWWEAWGPVYLGGTERLQQLYD